MVWGLKECLDDLQIKNLELIKDVGAEMAVPKKGEFMSQPHVEASGKRILKRERRDRDSRSLHPGLGEGSSAGKKKEYGSFQKGSERNHNTVSRSPREGTS